MNKYSPEEKIKLVKKIIEEKQSINSLSVSSILIIIKNYRFSISFTHI